MKFNSKTGLPFIDPSTGEPYIEHEYSDTLMCALLRANFPNEYREKERGDVHVSTTVNVPIVNLDKLNRIQALRRAQLDNV
jgi:hypothetical protein